MKPGEFPEGTLTEDDYLALLEVIRHLHACRTRGELKACFQEKLLLLFQAQAATWGWHDTDLAAGKIRNPKLEDYVGIPEEEVEPFVSSAPYFTSLSQKLVSSVRPIIAFDVDIPRENIQKEIHQFYKEHSEYKRKGSHLDRLKTGLIAVDRPGGDLSISFQRLMPLDKPITLRDIRVFELLCPHLFQSIKTIALNEDLKKHKTLTEMLAEVPTAMAMVNLRFRVIYGNASFQDLLSLEPGARLPRDLTDLMDREIHKYPPSGIGAFPTVDLPFYRLPKGVFRLHMSLLNPTGEEEDKCWLLRLKPVADPYAQMNLRMQEAGLTPREMEVAVLVRDGMDDSEIAGRLFLSPHTVHEHLKHIYQKMDVSSRSKLIARLKASEIQRADSPEEGQ